MPLVAAPSGRIDLAGYDTGDGGTGVRMLDIDRVMYDRAYNAVANRTLWFVAHLLFDTATSPSFGPAFRREWDAYGSYCAAFADALAEEAAPGATVIVQDYHLALTPLQLRQRRPDLRVGHFSHTPWAPPEYFRMLPDDVARQLLTGMLGADRLSFLDERWAAAFRACCADVLGAAISGGDVEYAGRVTETGVHPLGVHAADLRMRATHTDVVSRAAALREWAGDCQILLRIDRTELSKNIVRGLEAYRELLRSRPQWRGRVVHLALCSRRGTTCRSTASTPQPCSASPRRSRTNSPPRPGSRCGSRSATTGPDRWRHTASPTCCSSTRSGTE